MEHLIPTEILNEFYKIIKTAFVLKSKAGREKLSVKGSLRN